MSDATRPDTKRELRQFIDQRRAHTAPDARRRADHARTELILTILEQVKHLAGANTIPLVGKGSGDEMRAVGPDASRRPTDESPTTWPCGERPCISLYLSRDPEPDTLGLLGRLEGWKVLVPAMSGHRRSEPHWTRITPGGELTLHEGPHGIPEVSGESLAPEVLAEADIIIVPALAASLDGTRLGTGGGWYDRALTFRRPGVPILALVNDDEVMTLRPEHHDIPVTHLVTPTRVVTCG